MFHVYIVSHYMFLYDIRKSTSVSGKLTDFLVDLCAGSLLLPRGDLYYVVYINVHSVMAFLLGKA